MHRLYFGLHNSACILYGLYCMCIMTRMCSTVTLGWPLLSLASSEALCVNSKPLKVHQVATRYLIYRMSGVVELPDKARGT